MREITYINRQTKEKEKERVYGRFYLNLLYKEKFFLSSLLRSFFCHFPFFSRLYGTLQKTRFSKVKIKSFVKSYGIDPTEFIQSLSSFTSFNDFFIRKLKSTSRPIAEGSDLAILPADGRYLAFNTISNDIHEKWFTIKGKKFSLEKLLKNEELALQYAQGAMVIARLAPVDYHRFHFPFNCTAAAPIEIHGPLYSVNPVALWKNMEILSENKRTLVILKTKHFGTVLMIAVGATFVGTIHHTYVPEKSYIKGEEKGFFSFGGSCLILLFEPGTIQLDADLLAATAEGLETLGRMGESLGRSIEH